MLAHSRTDLERFGIQRAMGMADKPVRSYLDLLTALYGAPVAALVRQHR